jgi:hypothetical protein
MQTQENVAHISAQDSQKEKKYIDVKSEEKAVANHAYKNAAYYIRKNHEESHRPDGLHHHLKHF